jgi:hypothetical protein
MNSHRVDFLLFKLNNDKSSYIDSSWWGVQDLKTRVCNDVFNSEIKPVSKQDGPLGLLT